MNELPPEIQLAIDKRLAELTPLIVGETVIRMQCITEQISKCFLEITAMIMSDKVQSTARVPALKVNPFDKQV